VALSYLWPSFGVLFLMLFFLIAWGILILKKKGL